MSNVAHVSVIRWVHFFVGLRMVDLLFVALMAVYALIAVKVEQWSTLFSLGLKSETPQLFLSNQSLYHGTRMLLFAVTVAALFFVRTIPWYLGAACLAAAWFGSVMIGYILAFDEYRNVHREMIEYDNDLKVSDPAEYARQVAEGGPASHLSELEEGVRTTNRELFERLRRYRKLGI